MAVNEKNRTNIVQKRVLRQEEVSKILNNLSKYFYLNNFNINVKSKENLNWKIIISYKATGLKNGINVSISDNFIL